MPRKGERMSPEHKAKIAAAHRGKKQPWSAGERNPAKRPEVRAKISAALQGVSRSRVRIDIPKRPCACGCGTLVAGVYVRGHYWSVGRPNLSATKPCACGCGMLIHARRHGLGESIRD